MDSSLKAMVLLIGHVIIGKREMLLEGDGMMIQQMRYRFIK
ncbi:MAG: hypothetical protein SO362_07410 [Selenomonas montiformis]|nr:hypothetical protein [Selenomonas montiformis]